MSTVGSYVAFLAGNVVLGGFTMFLTFCIGIRFLVKPDTSRKRDTWGFSSDGSDCGKLRTKKGTS